MTMTANNDIVLDSEVLDQQEKVGFLPRLGAAAIDFGILIIPTGAASWYATWMAKSFTLMIVIFLLSSLYKPLMEAIWGATVGKMAIKAKVVKEDGTPIGFPEAFTRYIPWLFGLAYGIYANYQMMTATGYLDANGTVELATFMQEYAASQGIMAQVLQWGTTFIPLISALLIFSSAKKQAAHDILARTIVVRKPKVQ